VTGPKLCQLEKMSLQKNTSSHMYRRLRDGVAGDVGGAGDANKQGHKTYVVAKRTSIFAFPESRTQSTLLGIDEISKSMYSSDSKAFGSMYSMHRCLLSCQWT
jgi:hypothetical protein